MKREHGGCDDPLRALDMNGSGETAHDDRRDSDTKELEGAKGHRSSAAPDLRGSDLGGGSGGAVGLRQQQLGPEISDDRAVLASSVGARHPVLCLPPEARRIVYTTNMIESLHMQLRKIIKNRGHFPSDEAATKLLWLALRNINDGKVRSAREWKMAMNQFAVLYGDRFVSHAS